jgi:hypothetical protein
MLMVIGLSAGCSKGPGRVSKIEKVAPVSGTLIYKGAPLEHYQVTFHPTDGRRPALGVTDATGKFTLGTNKVGDGAPPGASQVSVTFAPPEVDNSLTSGGIENPALLPKPKVKIPAKYGNVATSGLTQNVPDSGLSDVKIELQ